MLSEYMIEMYKKEKNTMVNIKSKKEIEVYRIM